MTETELEHQFCFNCNDRKQCYTKPKDCTRIQEEIGLQEMTNEEWLRSCQPQELIRFLMNVAYGGQIRNVQKRTFDEEAEKWSKWLKEKHTE